MSCACGVRAGERIIPDSPGGEWRGDAPVRMRSRSVAPHGAPHGAPGLGAGMSGERLLSRRCVAAEGNPRAEREGRQDGREAPS